MITATLPIDPVYIQSDETRCEECNKLLCIDLKGQATIKCYRCGFLTTYKKTIDKKDEGN